MILFKSFINFLKKEAFMKQNLERKTIKSFLGIK